MMDYNSTLSLKEKRARQGSNLRPLDSKSITLSNWATGAFKYKKYIKRNFRFIHIEKSLIFINTQYLKFKKKTIKKNFLFNSLIIKNCHCETLKGPWQSEFFEMRLKRDRRAVFFRPSFRESKATKNLAQTISNRQDFSYWFRMTNCVFRF